MATSRTGTAKWKALVRKRRAQAKRDGVENCPMPGCGVRLDYTQGIRARNSVEVDHIVPHSQGGRDEYENTMVLCGHCNRRKSDNKTKVKRKRSESFVLQTSRQW